jgi:hypothetical protein
MSVLGESGVVVRVLAIPAHFPDMALIHQVHGPLAFTL